MKIDSLRERALSNYVKFPRSQNHPTDSLPGSIVC